jgi:hypothetical protein
MKANKFLKLLYYMPKCIFTILTFLTYFNYSLELSKLWLSVQGPQPVARNWPIHQSRPRSTPFHASARALSRTPARPLHAPVLVCLLASPLSGAGGALLNDGRTHVSSLKLGCVARVIRVVVWVPPQLPLRWQPTGYAWTAFGCHGAHIHRRSHGNGLHQDQRAWEGKFLRKRVIGVGFFLSSCCLNLQLRCAYVVSEDPNSLQIRLHASSTWLWFVKRFAVGNWNLISFLRKENPSLSC